MIQEMDMRSYISNRSENDILVDMRDESTFQFGTIPGAVNITLDSIAKLYQLPKDHDIYVFCQTGENSGEFVELLMDAGYNAFNLSGGYREYLRMKIAEQK